MHRLLKRQLKKIGYVGNNTITAEQCAMLLDFVDQAYFDADEDRKLIENSLEVSSMEMQKLYEKLKVNTQTRIKLSEEKYNRLVRNLTQYYFFYTRNAIGEITYLSDSVTDMLGYSKEEFKSGYRRYLTADPSNKLAIKYTQKGLMGEEVPPYNLKVYHKLGGVRQLEIMQLPIFDEHGTVVEMEGIVRDITEQMNIREQLDYTASNDSLTGIPNRLSLYHKLDLIIDKASANNTQFALLFLDLDHFKNINDTLGHDIGDKLLQAVATKISPMIRHKDLFARIGGDEFIIVLNDVNKIRLCDSVTTIMDIIRQDWIIDEFELKVSSSVGIATYPKDGADTQALMKNADIAMYAAKKMGRDSYSFFTENLNQIAQSEMRIERDMVKALENGEFMLYFQPKVSLENNAIVGAEALIRWQHPELGFITPGQFITLAENTGFISKLGRWVIEESMRALARFNCLFSDKINLSLNLSTRQIENDQVVAVIKEAIELNSIDAGQVYLEMTESIFMENSALALRRLNDIKNLGVHLSMDDFGTGYSSLSYLHQFPIDTLKIDKAFVDQITPCSTQAVLLDTILAMGATLGLEMVAEGVEHEYQRKYLHLKGCPYYQGYLFSKPLCEAQFIELVNTKSTAP